MSERWLTPPEVFRPLMEEFNFDLDAAADAETVRPEIGRYVKNALDGNEWPGQRIWCNPPYGLKLEPFVRENERQASTYGKLVVSLFPFRCRAAWWHEAVLGRAMEVRCVRKRIKFIRPDGTRGKFTGSCDSCIVVWGGYDGDRVTTLHSFEFGRSR